MQKVGDARFYLKVCSRQCMPLTVGQIGTELKSFVRIETLLVETIFGANESGTGTAILALVIDTIYATLAYIRNCNQDIAPLVTRL